MGDDQLEPGTPYALGQFAKAFRTATEHPDRDVRGAASARMNKWASVIRGLETGTTTTGSRTPMNRVPVWVTPEVVTGGFVTGEFMAGGAFLDHESDLRGMIGVNADANDRRALNAHFLTDAGLASLWETLETGRYDVNVPEEGALLVVAWLLQNDHIDVAYELLDVLVPWFAKLRFYPCPRLERPYDGPLLRLRTTSEVSAMLSELEGSRQYREQRETVRIWLPLYDRLVTLFLETVDGPVPTLRLESNGSWKRDEEGRFPVIGGWPCRTFPDGWQDRAEGWLEKYDRLQNYYPLCRRHGRRKGSFFQLAQCLPVCIRDPASLSGRDVGRIRMILARYIAKHGAPESPRHKALRASQTRQVEGPLLSAIASIVTARLAKHDDGVDLDALAGLLMPVTEIEAERWDVAAGTSIPESIARKASRCLRAPAGELIARDIIRSGETLAALVPQLSAAIESGDFSSPALRHLYGAIYRAFRKRRSLLLLNLEKQVQLNELPWVAAIQRYRERGDSSTRLARRTMEELVLLTLTAFPHAILPNPLLRELEVLAKAAGLELPLAEELAADIFMGRFSTKFVEAVYRNCEVLEGTLYSTYYNIDHHRVKPFQRNGGDTPLQRYCVERAAISRLGWGAVAANGMVIEQQQILTSHNLALLIQVLGLSEAITADAPRLAQNCFVWIVQRMSVPPRTRHEELVQLKQCAYAWRQLVFFLSSLPAEDHHKFLSWADEHSASNAPQLRSRLAPVVAGLRQAVVEQAAETVAPPKSCLRPFLGWTTGTHPLSVMDVPVG